MSHIQNHANTTDPFYGNPDLPRISSAYIADIFEVSQTDNLLFNIPSLPDFIAGVIQRANLPGTKQVIRALMLLERAKYNNVHLAKSITVAGVGQNLFAAAYMVALGRNYTSEEGWRRIWGKKFTYKEVDETADILVKSLISHSSQRIFDFTNMLFVKYGDK